MRRGYFDIHPPRRGCFKELYFERNPACRHLYQLLFSLAAVQKWKSKEFRSGLCAGQMISVPLLITRPWNFSVKSCLASYVKCSGAPSCTHQSASRCSGSKSPWPHFVLVPSQVAGSIKARHDARLLNFFFFALILWVFLATICLRTTDPRFSNSLPPADT